MIEKNEGINPYVRDPEAGKKPRKGCQGSPGKSGGISSSEDGKTWTELVKAAPWSARWGFGAAQLKEQLVIMGHLDDVALGCFQKIWGMGFLGCHSAPIKTLSPPLNTSGRIRFWGS